MCIEYLFFTFFLGQNIYSRLAALPRLTKSHVWSLMHGWDENNLFNITVPNYAKLDNFFPFWGHIVAYGSSQARSWMGDAAAFLHDSHSNSGSNPIFDLYHSSWQRWILNSMSEARDWTCVLMDTSWICFHWATTGTPETGQFRWWASPSSFGVHTLSRPTSQCKSLRRGGWERARSRLRQKSELLLPLHSNSS